MMEHAISQVDPILPLGGSRLALLAVKDETLCGELEALLHSRDYLVVKALGREAAATLTASPCRLAFMEDTEENKPLFSLLGALPGNRRRCVLAVLLTVQALSLDPRLSFSRSVDAVIHPTDCPELPELLERVLHQHQDTYAIWRELEDLGVRF